MIFHTARLATEKTDFRPVLPLCSRRAYRKCNMAKATYYEQLRDPRWQKRRLEIMQRDEFTCRMCMDTKTTLNVHHKHYHKGRSPWDYGDEELVTLCESCHEGIDDFEKARKEIFAKLNMDGPYSIHEALALIAGWAHNMCGYDLSSHRDRSPWNFAIGQATVLFDYPVVKNMDSMHELSNLLATCGDERRMRAIDRLIEDLRKPE